MTNDDRRWAMIASIYDNLTRRRYKPFPPTVEEWQAFINELDRMRTWAIRRRDDTQKAQSTDYSEKRE